MRPIFQLYNSVGKRHLELGRYWFTSGLLYGMAGFVGLIYVTDWKLFADKIPIYNTKFKEDS